MFRCLIWIGIIKPFSQNISNTISKTMHKVYPIVKESMLCINNKMNTCVLLKNNNIAVQWKIMQHLPLLLQIWLSCNWYSISGVWFFFGHFVSSPFPCAQSTRSAARAGYSHIQSMTSHCPDTATSGKKITALLVGMEIDLCKRQWLHLIELSTERFDKWERVQSFDKHARWCRNCLNIGYSYIISSSSSSSYKMVYYQTFILTQDSNLLWKTLG